MEGPPREGRSPGQPRSYPAPPSATSERRIGAPRCPRGDGDRKSALSSTARPAESRLRGADRNGSKSSSHAGAESVACREREPFLAALQKGIADGGIQVDNGTPAAVETFFGYFDPPLVDFQTLTLR